MRSAFVALAALAIVAVAVLTGYLAPHAQASTGPIPLDCNRACLENLVDQYLAAVVAHDPKRLPLSADVKYTENDQLMELGDGFWKTVQGRGNYTHIWADPEFGQVAYMGTMREAGQLLLLSLRLRVQLGRITEIESIYFKSGSGGPNNIAGMDAHKPEDMWFKSIPPAQQMSRQELIAVADGYFSGLQHNDGKGINGTGTYPFTDDCSRIENGSLTAKAPPRNPPPARRHRRVRHGLHGAVQARLLFRGAEHPSSPVSAGGPRAGSGLGPRGLRSRHGQQRRPFRWPALRIQGLQPAFEYPGDGGVPDRERQDSPGGNGRAFDGVSYEFPMAGRLEWELKDNT